MLRMPCCTFYFFTTENKTISLKLLCDSSNLEIEQFKCNSWNSMRIEMTDECVVQLSMHYGYERDVRFSSIAWNRMFHEIIDFFGAETHQVKLINAFFTASEYMFRALVKRVFAPLRPCIKYIYFLTSAQTLSLLPS